MAEWSRRIRNSRTVLPYGEDKRLGMGTLIMTIGATLSLLAGGHFSLSQWVLEHTYDEVRAEAGFRGLESYDLEDLGCRSEADPDLACDDHNPCTVDHCWVHRSALLGGSRDTCWHGWKFCSPEGNGTDACHNFIGSAFGLGTDWTKRKNVSTSAASV